MLLTERNISDEFRDMVRERLGMVLKDASMVLAGEKDAGELCFNLSTETAKFVNDETRWLTLQYPLFHTCIISHPLCDYLPVHFTSVHYRVVDLAYLFHICIHISQCSHSKSALLACDWLI